MYHSNMTLEELIRENRSLADFVDAEIRLRKQLEEEIRERKKELACHKQITEILQTSDLPVDVLISRILQVIVDAMRFPEMAECCITQRDKIYKTDGFKISGMSLSQDIVVNGVVTGKIEVGYPADEMHAGFESVLPEEKDLLYTLAARLGNFLEGREKADNLAESETKIRHYFRNNPQPMWIYDLETLAFLEVNDAAAKKYGYTEEEFLRMTIMDIRPEEDKDILLKDIGDTSEALNFAGTWRHKKRNGEIFFVEISSHTIEYDSRKARLVLANDVTRMKEAIDELRKLSGAVEQSPVSIVITDLDGNIEYANPKASETTGYDLADLRGKNPRILQSGETSKEEYQALWDNLGSGREWKGVFHNKKKTGEFYWESSTIAPIKDSTGKITHYVALKEDITEQKKIQESLKTSEERFRQVTDSSLTVIWEVDPAGLFTYVSPMSEKVWGYKPEELIGVKYHYNIHPDYGKEAYVNKIRPWINNKEVIKNLVNPVQKPDGSIIWVNTSSVPVIGQKGELIGYRGADNDITERKKALELAMDSEATLNYAQQIAGMGSWELDLASGKITCSENFYRVLGLEPYQENIPEEYLIKTVHPDDRHFLDEMKDKLMRTRKPVNADMRLIMPDGSAKWIQNDIVPLCKGENLIALKGVFIDITEKKHAERKIKDQNERLNAIINAIPDLIIVGDQDGVCLEFYSPSNRRTRVSDAQIVGKNLNTIFNGEVSAIHYEAIKKCLSSGKLVTYEYSVARPEGEAWFEGRMTPIGENRVLVIIRDFTENKLAEMEIRKLSLAVNQSPASIVITDLKANIEYVNPAFIEVSGYSFEEVRGKNPRLLNARITDKSVYRHMWKTISGDRVWHGEWINRKKTGELYWEKVSITPIHDEKGETTNYLAVKQDISDQKLAENKIMELNTTLERKVRERTAELAVTNAYLIKEIDNRKKTEEALTQARKEAEQASLAKSQFLANMSHEIRTPMNAVLGYSELLSSTPLESLQRDYINSIKSSGKSLLTIINDILDLSKIEAGKMELEYDFIRTEAFFSEFPRIFSFKLDEKKVRFILEIASGTPPGILADEARLRQIVFNLIGNAIKFTSEGYIILRVYSENPEIVEYSAQRKEVTDLVIEVEDTGIGISEGMQDSIFDPFVQEQNFKKYGGTGLGLAICKRLVSLMNGTIGLRSEPGKGSVFTVRIPDTVCLLDFEDGRSDITVNPSDVIFRKSTVLIVDDVQHNRSFLKDALKDTAVQTFEAENGAIGFEMAKTLLPDLIISDIRMPVMDGFELLRMVREDPGTKNIPVLAYSASALKEQREKIHNSEFSGLLIKPVRLNDLFTELMKVLPHEIKTAPVNVNRDTPANELADIENIPELIRILDSDITDSWKTFSVRQPLNEIRIFGSRLNDLGIKHNAKSLIKYGTEIIDAADNFHIEKILNLINGFPAQVMEIRTIQNQRNREN